MLKNYRIGENKMDETLMFIIIFSGIWGLIGIIFSLVGILVLRNRKKKEEKCTAKTWGKVKDIVRQTRYDSDRGYSSSWHPVFEYNVGELKFVKESLFGSSQSKFAIGQNVEIYYNPENYNEFYIKEETIQKTLGKIFTIVGIVAILIAVITASIILIAK